MPITIEQVFLFLGVVIGLMVGLDWLLSKVKTDWTPLPWEEDETF